MKDPEKEDPSSKAPSTNDESDQGQADVGAAKPVVQDVFKYPDFPVIPGPEGAR